MATKLHDAQHTAIIDAHPLPDCAKSINNLSLIGMSLGGYLAARTVAFEHRFRAAVFFDGVYDCYAGMRAMLPKEAIAAFEAGDSATCDKIIYGLMTNVTNLRWLVTQGIWSFGAKDLADFLNKFKLWTMKDIAADIQCPCLVLEAQGDVFTRGHHRRRHGHGRFSA